MRSIVNEHRRTVVGMLRKSGVPRQDLDDEVQRTFIVAADRLEDVRPGSERSFLLQVARNLAWHAHRSLARRREFLTDELPERSEPVGTPEDLAGCTQIRALLSAALASLDEPLRAVFVLYELEELDMNEIAATLGLRRGTVASRLRRARAQIRRSLPVIELALGLGLDGEDIEGPPPLLRERVSRLERTLLRIGAAPRASPSLRDRTLASCRVLMGR